MRINKRDKNVEHQSYNRQLMLKYLNNKEDKLLDLNEQDQVSNLILVFTRSIYYLEDSIAENDIESLHENITCESQEEFRNWAYNKYNEIHSDVGGGAEKRFLFSAFLVRELYEGKLENVKEGGDYAVELLKAKELNQKEHEFIPSNVISNITKNSIDVYTKICSCNIIDTNKIDYKTITNVFKNSLDEAIKKN